MAISISGQVFSLLSCSTVSGRFDSVVQSVITGTSHIIVVLLMFMVGKGKGKGKSKVYLITAREGPEME